jgi:hypothetical protein
MFVLSPCLSTLISPVVESELRKDRVSYHQLADLDELALRCRDAKARIYLREAISCYKAGAMRAAIISTWIALAFDFIDKLATLEMQGDKQAIAFAAEFRKIRESGDIAGSLKFEKMILERAHKELALISDLEYEDLDRLYRDRHRCAHPSMISDEELYQPTAEQVRYHIRSAVDAMLSQPPTSGKVALAHLEAQVKGDYFPEDEAKAATVLRSGVLERPRESLVRNFTIILMKTIADPASSPAERKRSAAALAALRNMHPGVSNQVVADKLVGILRGMKDEDLPVAIASAARIRDSQELLAEDLKIRFTQYIEGAPDEQIPSVAGFGFDLAFLKEKVVVRVNGLSDRYFSTSDPSTHDWAEKFQSERELSKSTRSP